MLFFIAFLCSTTREAVQRVLSNDPMDFSGNSTFFSTTQDPKHSQLIFRAFRVLGWFSNYDKSILREISDRHRWAIFFWKSFFGRKKKPKKNIFRKSKFSKKSFEK